MKQDFIVTSQEVNKEGKIITIDDFIDAAGSEDGLDIEGKLYIDTYNLDKLIYDAIIDSMPNAIFFTLNNDIPSYLKNKKVIKWTNPKPIAIAEIEEVPKKVKEEKNLTKDDEERISNLLESMTSEVVEEKKEEIEEEPQQREGRVYLFGSSKGGTGKTFTCLISAYRYAKMNPGKRVAIADFDITDGQVGISIHKVKPTFFNYYKQWKLGDEDFRTMEAFKVKNTNFPENIDFYLAPRDLFIRDNNFWNNIFKNLIESYDAIFFDSGIDYMRIPPISTLYKIADKIILVSTTSIKSVSSVTKQIMRLKGEEVHVQSPFKPEDEIGDKLNLVITQANPEDEMNKTIFKAFGAKVNLIGVFGNLTSQIQQAEYYGMWSIFDGNKQFNAVLDKILE